MAFRHLFKGLFLAAGLSCVSAPGHGDGPYDLILRGGRIIDGTGNPWYVGDVAVRDEYIVKIGVIPPDTPARRVIDVRGLVVCPGFIDMHSHSERTLFVDGDAHSKIRQGVTTDVLGEHTSGGPR